MKPLLVDGVTVVRGGHVLLEQLHFEARAGEVTGLIADNPERLDLFIDLLAGVEDEQEGRVLLGGSAASAGQRRRGVGVARERGALVDTLAVVDNLFLSRQRLHTTLGWIDHRRRRDLVTAVSRRLEFQVDPGQPLGLVNPSLRPLIDLARVVVQDPPCLVVHGVTRTMTLHQYEAFTRLVADWKRRSKGLVLVPVNTDDVRRFVDRLYLLQGTRLFEVARFQELGDDQLQGFFLGGGRTNFHTAADPVFRAKQFIEERVAEAEIDFPALADSLAMSYDNFRRRFKTQIGQSPNQYFLSAKIEKAKELILYSDAEIKDVAAQVGFADPYYFSRVFKDRTGLAPARFRQGDPPPPDPRENL